MGLKLQDAEDRITVRDADLEDVAQGADDVTYTLRPITPDKSLEITRKHTTRPINRRTGQREEQVDRSAVMDDLVDYALESWTGVTFRGQPAPCDRSHKLLLDFVRKAALLGVAGLNAVAAQEDREASFREPAKVL